MDPGALGALQRRGRPPAAPGPRLPTRASPGPAPLKGWLARAGSRLRGSILDELRRGLSPSRVALAVALGAWLGIFPALGTTTLLCFLVGWLLGLNQPLLQAVNFLAYPLQLALLLPFFSLGSRVFGGPAFSLGLGQLLERLRLAPWDTVKDFWWVGVHAWAVWAALGLFVVPAAWWLLARLFQRLSLSRSAR